MMTLPPFLMVILLFLILTVLMLIYVQIHVTLFAAVIFVEELMQSSSSLLVEVGSLHNVSCGKSSLWFENLHEELLTILYLGQTLPWQLNLASTVLVST